MSIDLKSMWAQLVATALGVWLMVAPAVLGYARPASDSDRLVGPLIAAFSFVAASGVTRPLRWVNLPLGAWLLLAPWVLGGYSTAATINSLVVGVAVIGLALVKGTVKDRFGGGWSSLLPGRRIVPDR